MTDGGASTLPLKIDPEHYHRKLLVFSAEAAVAVLDDVIAGRDAGVLRDRFAALLDKHREG